MSDDKLLDHEYDGIQEYDNPIPLWLTITLVACIIFSIGYIPYYHMLGGPSSIDEYNAEMAAAQQIKDQQAAAVAQINVDDILQDAAAMDEAASAFATNCVACHGANAEGGIGPNLRDATWVNGDGSFGAIQEIVSKGVLAKGMPAWESVLGARGAANMAAYVYNLRDNDAAPAAPESAAAATAENATEAEAAGSEMSGAEVYASSCASCHGPAAKGLVGPDLTDAEWKNGDGSLSSIEAVVRDGILEKGMPAWGAVLGNDKVMAVSAYIKSLSE